MLFLAVIILTGFETGRVKVTFVAKIYNPTTRSAHVKRHLYLASLLCTAAGGVHVAILFTRENRYRILRATI